MNEKYSVSRHLLFLTNKKLASNIEKKKIPENRKLFSIPLVILRNYCNKFIIR